MIIQIITYFFISMSYLPNSSKSLSKLTNRLSFILNTVLKKKIVRKDFLKSYAKQHIFSKIFVNIALLQKNVDGASTGEGRDPFSLVPGRDLVST